LKEATLMRSIFLTFLLLGFFRLYSQTGNYFLSHFSPTEKRFDNVCFDIVQDDHGLLYFATRKGVLQYDGKNWDPIPGNGAIYSLLISRQGSIFWSGASGYGVVGKDDQGFTQLKTTSGPGASEVFQGLEAGERIYFLNEESLFVITEKSDTIIIKSSGPTGLFIGMTEIFGKIYLNAEQGIFKVDGNKLVPSLLGFSTDDEILFATTYQNTALIGLANGKIFICRENLIPHEVHLEDQTYADASVIVSACWVNRDLFVVGTLRGGMIFVNATTGKTQQIINYATGLPDNEVYAMMSDNSQSIWSAHEYGFTRVSPYLPFRSFSHYTGLQGNLL
jgi:ligand-binding sensor domain-containing protein